MKTFQTALRLAVVAVAFMAACFGWIFWKLETCRLRWLAFRAGWKVEFVDRIPGDIGLKVGVTLFDEKVILLRTAGLEPRHIAEALRHELCHATGTEYAQAPAWMTCLGTFAAVAFAFETVAGSILAVTTQVPATYDAAGYGASAMVYTAVGEITDLGPLSRTYATVSHSPIASRQVTQKKGSFTLDPIDYQMAWDQSDAGQDILRAAEDTDAILTFELTKQGGDKRYFTAQVSKVSENFGGSDNVNQAMITLLPQKVFVRYPA